MYKHLFSVEVKELIRESRVIAIETGYDCVSTIHLFLADCKINKKGALKKFSFQDENDFLSFLESIRKTELNLDNLESSLPLTVEAEEAFRNSAKEQKKFFQKLISPCHLFLAAASDKNSLFFSCFPGEAELYDKLVNYYSEEGLLKPEKSGNENILKRVTSFFKRVK